MRANQAARAAAAAKARKAADLQRQRDQAALAAAMATVHPANGELVNTAMLNPSVPSAAPMLTSAHWSYDGDTGPANWGRINPAWAKCGTGTRQSPIDLRDGMKVDLEQIAFDYRTSGFNVIDNGHTVQVGVGLGNYITVGNRTYELQQFHFHRPSEEKHQRPRHGNGGAPGAQGWRRQYGHHRRAAGAGRGQSHDPDRVEQSAAGKEPRRQSRGGPGRQRDPAEKARVFHLHGFAHHAARARKTCCGW